MLLVYIIGVNIISLIITAIDKHKAIEKKWRIPERTFWGVALLGGSFGILIGMHVFRHKTNHTSFKVGMPLLLLINIGYCCLLS